MTMLLSNSVLRRYTPPTCTLEIVAKSSPLSRWVGQTVMKDLRFELRFDDPRKPEDKRVTIRGDRTDLETLCDVVNSYVQDFLEPSSTQLPLALHTSAANSIPDNNGSAESSALPVSGITHSQSLTAQAFEEEPNESSVGSLEPNSKLLKLKPRTPSTQIYLKPRGLLSHNLFLGQLANEESGPVVDLSVLQLFDLATALDEYAAEGVALPNLNRASGKKTPPAWSWAAVALVAVGVTTAGVKLLNQPESAQQVATNADKQQSNPAETPSASQLPATPASPLPTSTLPTPLVPSPLSSSPVLPPPTPVTVPPSPTPLNPPASQQRPELNINPSPPTAPVRTAAPPQPSAPAPTRVATAPAPRTSSTPSAKTSPSPAGNTQTQQSTGRTPTTPFPLPSLPPIAPPSSADGGSDRNVSEPTAASSAPSDTVNQAESAPTQNTADTRLSDTIPQVKEARSYLQQRWQPPSGLTQTLEYRLLLNADGSIRQITPLGNAAQDYISRTNIPRLGEPFVSPTQGEGNPTIRVIFTPDGQVNTFKE